MKNKIRHLQLITPTVKRRKWAFIFSRWGVAGPTTQKTSSLTFFNNARLSLSFCYHQKQRVAFPPQSNIVLFCSAPDTIPPKIHPSWKLYHERISFWTSSLILPKFMSELYSEASPNKARRRRDWEHIWEVFLEILQFLSQVSLDSSPSSPSACTSHHPAFCLPGWYHQPTGRKTIIHCLMVQWLRALPVSFLFQSQPNPSSLFKEVVNLKTRCVIHSTRCNYIRFAPLVHDGSRQPT